LDTPDFPQEFKAGSTSARDYLNLLKSENELEWTFISPAIEMHPGGSGKRTGNYRTGLESPVFDEKGKSRISVEDLAVAIADEAENGRHIRQRFTVGY
jgi:putative NADH-flavin reductase